MSAKDHLYLAKGDVLQPKYLHQGNAMQMIAPIALQFCQGEGLDIGCNKWPLQGAMPIDRHYGGDAMALPPGPFDYIFSSHCLEHLIDPMGALDHWRSRLKPGGVLFLYLPHPDMIEWRPEHERGHLHIWYPTEIVQMLEALKFAPIIRSDRDMMWSFSVVGFVPET